MSDDLALVDANVVDSNVLARSLVTLLSLTSDAVIAFDAEGRIILANTEAERLFRVRDKGLVETDVRDLFPAANEERSAGFEKSLPFSVDGTTTRIVCERADGTHVSLGVRCDHLRGPGGTYLLVAHAIDPRASDEQERARLVDELSRANRRLSGTLRIVLETLDSTDVGMLFDRVLKEISETLDAWATLAYVAENDGFRLRGGQDALGTAPAPLFMAHAHPVVQMLYREGRPLRLRVMRPTRDDLRKGRLLKRNVVEEESLETLSIANEDLAPFASFVLNPVWFGGSAIALLMVGWRHEHNVGDNDVRLLEAVCEYLSVQLAGAFAAMRAQHAEHLEALGTQLRERLMSVSEISDEVIDTVFKDVATGVGATCVKLVGNRHQRTTLAKLANEKWHAMPLDLVALSTNRETCVTHTSSHESLANWLGDFGFPTDGVVVALGTDEDTCRGYLLLRDLESGPFDESDMAFIRSAADDVLALDEGERARTRDKRISQALQWGMRNELQHVDGITAESCYCSATEEAYVGGDFYDLIRLPGRHACIVMGDVSGKGVESASVSSAVKTALGAYAWEGVKPARMVTLLNNFLLGFSRVETFVTMFVAVADLEKGSLTYCSAGHPPALIVRASSGELTTLEVQSGVVGAFAGMSFVDGEVSISSGDVLLLYTDGTTEARDPQGVFFGEEGLREAVARESAMGFEGICNRLLLAVETFAGGTLNDDVALVAARFDVIGE